MRAAFSSPKRDARRTHWSTTPFQFQNANRENHKQQKHDTIGSLPKLHALATTYRVSVLQSSRVTVRSKHASAAFFLFPTRKRSHKTALTDFLLPRSDYRRHKPKPVADFFSASSRAIRRSYYNKNLFNVRSEQHKTVSAVTSHTFESFLALKFELRDGPHRLKVF